MVDMSEHLASNLDSDHGSSSGVSVLRGQLQALGFVTPPSRSVRVWEGSDPIPAPTREYVLGIDDLDDQEMARYRAWVVNNELAIEDERSGDLDTSNEL